MREHISPLWISLFLIMVVTMSVYADYQPGQSYHGFVLKEKKFVKEVNATCLLFEHEKSGARLLKIAADDPNKTFSIAFKTVPESDAGTPHIMEHSVLNGSKSFPVKSPFDVLAKGSLNTFLNAMTGSDITIYPVASMNDKDFFNLMYVYLDAVFNPLIYDDPRILDQEGWHYELTDAESPVVLKGVVYNEMKGAFSNPLRELGYQVDKNLFPDNGYGFSSGGYPPAIPSLTHEQFLDFHRKYYHPSNSYIFLYGDADLDKELAFIDREYLSTYERSATRAFIPLQKPFAKMKKVTAPYSIAEDADTKDQTYLALSYVCGLNTDQKLVLALDILADVLVNQESGPIRLALQQAGIGKEVRASLDPNRQNVFQITVQNANAADNEQFLEIVKATLQEVIRTGLDKEAVEGTLNRKEFRLREGDDAQKGLSYNFQAINGWFFADDPFLSLEWEKPLAAIKEDIHKGELEKVIQKYFLDNQHALLLMLVPKPGLEKELNGEVGKKLADYKAGLNEEQKAALIKQTQELIDYQKREDTPEALATVPMLNLQDINPRAEWYAVTEKKLGAVPMLHYDTFTNNVIYTQLYFDVRVLPEELLPYAALLCELLGSLNTENLSFSELDKQLNLHTGGFSAFMNYYVENYQDDRLLPKFVISAKAMNTKVEKMVELMDEIIHRSRIDDRERLKSVLIRHQSRLDNQVKSNGFDIARKRLSSYFSNAGRFTEMTSGLEYYWFITELVEAFDNNYKTIVDHLKKTASLLFNQNNLVVAVTVSKEDIHATGPFMTFVSKLAQEPVPMREWTFTEDKKNEGLLAASKVQYVIQGYNFKKLGYEWDGKMQVLSQILSRDWLNNQIRVIGGAYGGFSSIQPSGDIFFASYRDPNLTETLGNYKAAVDYLDAFQADEETMTRYIIGTIARMDRPLTPSQKGNTAVQYYFQKLTPEQRQKERQAVLNTTASDIRNMKKLIADFLEAAAICVYGNEEKIMANKDLFGAIKATTK